MTIAAYKHWHVVLDDDRILWLCIDRQDTAVNTLNAEVFAEFDAILSTIATHKPVAVVLASGKANGFIAGADISQFSSFSSSDEAFVQIRGAQKVLDKLAALPIPTIAMISGFCLGGGCEIALACTYRIAEDIPQTRIGLPEVKLGIHPGWGGTVRLPALVGAINAMKIILPGAALSASRAARIGLVDVAVPTRALKRAVRWYALHQPASTRASGLARLTNAAWLRPVLGRNMLRQLHRKVREAHYPAAFAVVRNWMKVGIGKHADTIEAKSIAKLLMHDTSHQLVRVFFLQERMKTAAKKGTMVFHHVHVIGAGTMGGDIAAWCALRGLTVSLQDQSAACLAPAIKRAYTLFSKKLREPRLVQAAMDRLYPDVAGDGVKKADIVIEAIAENCAAKQQLYRVIEPKLKPEAILATNTSSIPLDQLNTVLQNPERLVGMHFFNPVAKMPLVEVVRGAKTTETIMQNSLAFVAKIGRLPLEVKSAAPGFLVNRLLMPYLMEAMQLYEEGVPAELLDRIATDFGMAMGPIALVDTVGLDVCLSVARILAAHYGGEIPAKLETMVSEGYLGCKSNRGFYTYKNGKRLPNKAATHQVNHAVSFADLRDRMLFRLLNESVACLEAGIVSDADLLDAGMIFGAGFAPFRGGPMRWIRQQGADVVLRRLSALQQQYGDRFTPVAGWHLLEEQAKS